ncbi:MAG TPA: Ig-like domain-containing protein, partial [Daejeonella sp.]|nr:Ig-like domain-containing protein [Daejeonella sp.]
MQSPTGGPKDSIPPGIVNEVPKNFTKNFTAKKIEIEFNEFVKLSNEYTEISISPAMDIPPVFKVKKENLEIEFKQELEANTTYSINFGKAIADVNESNILKNYSYVFSTGNEIDSLSISGKVINSLTKEKQKDVTVFILPVSQDSLFGKKKASVFNITDTAGTFKLSNLREDTYKLYALLEQGGDRIYNGQNEEIGFLQNPIKLTKDTSGIVLQVFKEYPNVLIVKDRSIEGDGRISLTFNRPIINPTINIIEPASIDQNKTVEFSLTRDSATIWIPELNFDSIDVVVNSAGKALDTVTLRRNKRDTYIKSLVASDNLSGSKIRPGSELILKLSSPIQSYQESQITLLED